MASTSNQEKLFQDACKENNLENIISFVQQGCPVNTHVDSRFGKKFSGYTPLHFAVKHKNKDALIYLLNKDADITEKSANSWTPVHLAFYNSYHDLILTIFQHSKIKTYNHVIDNTGLTHFHICCALDVPVVEKFITISKAKINFSVSLLANKYAGFTPLHFAAQNGNTSTTSLLLENGANLQLKCARGFTPLHVACLYSRFSVVELLLTYDPDLYTLRTKDKEGRTALHYAAMQGSVSIVDLLMENGASINNSDNKKLTPFDVAVKSRKYEVFDAMLPQYKNEDRTPINFSILFNSDDFHDACRQGNLKDTKRFLEYGFSVNSQTGSNAEKQFHGYTALHYAVENDCLDVVIELLKNGADITIQNYYGCTPVHLAYEKKLNYLILHMFQYSKNNTYVDVADRNGRTHFHICCTLDAPNIIEGFIKNGVDVNCSTLRSDSDPGFTPLHFAIRARSPATVELLSKNGADPLAKCIRGVTPLQMACNSIDSIIARFVLNNIDLTIRDEENRFLLHHVFYRNPDNSIIDWILNQMKDQIETDYNYGDSRRLSLLHIACFRGKTDIVQPLLDQDCCPNSRIVFKQNDTFAPFVFGNINPGVTPLHIAFYKKDTRLAEQLILAGADINAEDVEGYTPIAYIDCSNWGLRWHPKPDNLISELDEFIARHISKLRIAELYVSSNVKRDFTQRIRDVFCQRMFTEIIVDKRLCKIELEKLELIKINGCAENLRSILHINENTLYKLVQDKDVITFLNPEYLNNLSKEFPMYGFMIKAQVNKGLRRAERVRKAKDSLKSLTGINWPDTCSDLILKYLGIEHIENLIYANIMKKD